MNRPIAIRRFSRAAGAAFAVMLLGGCAHFDSHYGTARIELVRQLTLNPDAAREDFQPEPVLEAVEPLYFLLPDDFLVDELGRPILYSDIGQRAPGVFASEAGRTVTRGRCNLSCFFGLTASGPRRDPLRARFAAVQPELALTSNGQLEVQIRVTAVGDFPGTLTLQVTRTNSGEPNPPVLQFAAGSMAELQAQLSSNPSIKVPPPAGMNNRDRRVIVEDIVAVAIWDPQDADPCDAQEKLRVRWEFATANARFHYRTSTIARVGQHRSGVSAGATLQRDRKPDGRVEFSVPVQTFLSVNDPDACCGVAGQTYEIIQFVRHEWNLKEAPAKSGQDTWSLDVLDTEIARAQSGQSYDPTFTHNPRGTNPGAPPLVYPGPDPQGNQSITQTDLPGISEPLFARFQNAPGSEFVFHFLALLVCRLEPSEAPRYLANGMVRQFAEYKLRITFRGSPQEPSVVVQPINSETFDPCRSFTAVLDALDRQRRGRSPAEGRLRDGYERPRDHQVAVPR